MNTATTENLAERFSLENKTKVIAPVIRHLIETGILKFDIYSHIVDSQLTSTVVVKFGGDTIGVSSNTQNITINNLTDIEWKLIALNSQLESLQRQVEHLRIKVDNG